MNPDSPAPGRRDSLIGTPVKVVGDGCIVEFNRSNGDGLLYCDEIFDVKQVMVGTDPKAADRHIIAMEKQTQLQPG